MAGLLRTGFAVAVFCGLLLALPGCGKKDEKAGASGGAQPAGRKPGETNVANVLAEIAECRRKDGVLTVQLRFRNAGDKPVTFYPVSRNSFDPYYVVAEDKKYFVLRDEENVPLAPTVNPGGDVFVSLPPGGTYVFWAKFPAPPAAVKTVSFHTSVTPPFADVPISDG